MIARGGEQHLLVDGEHIALCLFRKSEAVHQRGMDRDRHWTGAFLDFVTDRRPYLAGE